MIRILQLSDVHYRTDWHEDMNIVIDALERDITHFANEQGPPNIVVFSGDLVYYGENYQDFEHAKKYVLDRVISASGISPDNFFIVPGNHDISRKDALNPSYLENGLRQELVNVQATNKFIDEHMNSGTHGSAFARLQNFENFFSKHFDRNPITSNVFLRTYVRKVNDYNVGIACFNSTWRATGEGTKEYGQLLIGEKVVDTAENDLDGCDIKIAIFHHPINWLKEFDQTSVEPRLQHFFDLSLFGHVHRPSPSIQLSPLGKNIVCQCGCLYQSREHFNGYHLIDVDPSGIPSN